MVPNPSFSNIQEQKLQDFADKINYKMYIDPARLQETLEAGDAEAKIRPIFIQDNKDVCEYSPYEHSKYKTCLKFDDTDGFRKICVWQFSYSIVEQSTKPCTRFIPKRRLRSPRVFVWN